MNTTQRYSSANTSINSSKLPASTKKINWELYRGKNVLDFGGGKFDNLKEFLKSEYEIDLFIYDKYNRTEEENEIAMTCEPSLVICNNVLNVIAEDNVVIDMLYQIESFGVPCIFSVYEGDRSGEGKPSKNDCYQRNEKVREYLRFFKVMFDDVVIKNNLIYA